MASGRRNPPLFEMLDRSDENPSATGTRRPQSQTHRADGPDPSAPKPPHGTPPQHGPSDLDRSGTSSPETAPSGRPSTMTFPQTTVWAAVAVAVAAAVVTWTVGYNLGYDTGRQDREAGLTLDPPLNDPLLMGGSAGGTSRTSPDGSTTGLGSTPGRPSAGGESGRSTASGGANSSGSGSVPSVLVPPGTPSGDSRVVGENYLALADLPRDEAQRAIEFLETRGVRAIAVRALDSGRRTSNNPALYRVFSVSLGVPGDQFSRLAPQRRSHEAQVKEIGRIWARDHEGTSDFRDPQWTRFNG